jgi:Protein of unknown function (DUF3592)
MIHNDHELTVRRAGILQFLDMRASLRGRSSAEEVALVSRGWREERARLERRDSRWRSAFFALAFAFFALIFLAGCGFLVILVAAFALDWRANNRYLPNSCVVLDKRLATGEREHVFLESDIVRTERKASYKPEIKIQHEVDGRNYEVWTSGAIGGFSSDRAAQQAFVDSYRVGATYPCWYDPDHPDRAILVRGYAWVSYGALIVPIAFLVFGGGGIRCLWKHAKRTWLAKRDVPAVLLDSA